MRRVLQHLSDDRPSHFRVRPALDLDERRHGVLIDDQVIDGPHGAATGRRRDALFPLDEYPAARVPGSNLLPIQQFRVLRDQRLQFVLGGEGRLLQSFESTLLGPCVDALGHVFIFDSLIRAAAYVTPPCVGTPASRPSNGASRAGSDRTTSRAMPWPRRCRTTARPLKIHHRAAACQCRRDVRQDSQTSGRVESTTNVRTCSRSQANSWWAGRAISHTPSTTARPPHGEHTTTLRLSARAAPIQRSLRTTSALAPPG